MSLPLLRLMAAGSDIAQASGATLLGATLSDSQLQPTNASVGYQINADGDEYTYSGWGASYASIGTWLTSGVAADYECLMSITGLYTDPADVEGSALDTWLACDTTRSWNMDVTTDLGDVEYAEMTIYIRSASTQIVIASAVVDFDVEVVTE